MNVEKQLCMFSPIQYMCKTDITSDHTDICSAPLLACLHSEHPALECDRTYPNDRMLGHFHPGSLYRRQAHQFCMHMVSTLLQKISSMHLSHIKASNGAFSSYADANNYAICL